MKISKRIQNWYLWTNARENPSTEIGLKEAMSEGKIQSTCPRAITLAIEEVEKCL